MVTATFKYREFLPKNDLPSDMTQVSFLGDDELVDILETLISCVTFDRSHLIDYELQYLNKQMENNKSDIIRVKEQISIAKKQNAYFMFKKGDAYKEYKILKDKLAELQGQAESLFFNAGGLDEDRFYTDKEVKNKIAKVLSDLKFVCQESKTHPNGVLEEKLYCSIPDDQLKVLANNKVVEMSEYINNKKKAIDKKYGVATDIVQQMGDFAESEKDL